MPHQYLDVQRIGDVVVVDFRCAQIPDSGIIEELKEELRMVLQASNKIVLDLANVEYLSSAALGVLIVFDKRAKATACRVHICNLRPAILEILQITKLDRLFTIHNDRASALSGFESLP